MTSSESSGGVAAPAVAGGEAAGHGPQEVFRIEPRLKESLIVASAVKYLALPLILLWFFPGPEHGRELFVGLNKAQIAIGLVFAVFSYFAYAYWKYLLKARRLGGSLGVVDSSGVFCNERRQLFRWQDVFSVNAVRGYSMLGSPTLNLIHKNPVAEGADTTRPSYSSHSWRLEATDVNVTALHGLVCALHRESKHPDDLYRR